MTFSSSPSFFLHHSSVPPLLLDLQEGNNVTDVSHSSTAAETAADRLRLSVGGASRALAGGGGGFPRRPRSLCRGEEPEEREETGKDDQSAAQSLRLSTNQTKLPQMKLHQSDSRVDNCTQTLHRPKEVGRHFCILQQHLLGACSPAARAASIDGLLPR